MTFIQFLFYGLGAVIAPRVTLAIAAIDLSSGDWTLGLAVWCFISASESGRSKFAAQIKIITNIVHHAVTGRQLIVERIIEKIVEKTVTVEKVVERIKIQRIKVKVQELSASDAYACLGCEPGASREALSHGYKQMIQRVHPDKGGSVYLASIVNQAKTMLLN